LTALVRFGLGFLLLCAQRISLSSSSWSMSVVGKKENVETDHSPGGREKQGLRERKNLVFQTLGSNLSPRGNSF
jgi:hypothetical protein